MVSQRDTDALPFNPNVMRWARVRARLDYDDAAQKIGVAPLKIEEWENAISTPTVRQARLLAEVYDRPFLEFFAHDVPEILGHELVPDFRFHRIGPTSLEMAALERIHEWAASTRINALDLFEQIGEEPKPLYEALATTVSTDPETAGANARAFMKMPDDYQTSMTAVERGKLALHLRVKLENLNILVLKKSDITKLRTRGICLFSRKLPIIIYGNEAPGAQAFTLAHEFGHVLLGESAISGAPRSIPQYADRGRRIENWCNHFAAAFLMPPNAVLTHPATPQHFSREISDGALNTIASAFGVSRHAMLIRLVTLGRVSANFYWRKKRNQFLREESDFKPFGRAPYYASRFKNALGDLYTSLVFEALGSGRIQYQTAADYMGAKKIRHILDIRDHLGK